MNYVISINSLHSEVQQTNLKQF